MNDDSQISPGQFQPKSTAMEAMSKPRYSGVATFMRAPQATSAADVDIALIGVPYDGAVTNRPIH